MVLSKLHLKFFIVSTLLPCSSLKNIFKKTFYSLLSVLGLCCCSRAFPQLWQWGLLSSCSVRASHSVTSLVISLVVISLVMGSRTCGLQKLQHAGSVAVACKLQNTVSIVGVHRLSHCMARSGKIHVPCIGRQIFIIEKQ